MKKLNKTLIFTTAAAAVLAMGVNDYVHNDQLTVHAEITKNDDNEHAYYYNAASGAASVAAISESNANSTYFSTSSVLSSMESSFKRVDNQYSYSATSAINRARSINNVLSQFADSIHSFISNVNTGVSMVKKNYSIDINSSAASAAVSYAALSSLYIDGGVVPNKSSMNDEANKFNSYIGNNGIDNSYYINVASSAVSIVNSKNSIAYSKYSNAVSLFNNMENSVDKIKSEYAYSAASIINNTSNIRYQLSNYVDNIRSFTNQTNSAFSTVQKNYSQDINSSAASAAISYASLASLYLAGGTIPNDKNINENTSKFNLYIESNNSFNINDYYYNAASGANSVANSMNDIAKYRYPSMVSLFSSMESSIKNVQSQYAYSASDIINYMRNKKYQLNHLADSINSFTNETNNSFNIVKNNYLLDIKSSATNDAVSYADLSSLYVSGGFYAQDIETNNNISKFNSYITDKTNGESNSSSIPSITANSNSSSSIPESSSATNSNSVSISSVSASSSSESSSVISSSSSELSSATSSSSVMSSAESSIAESSNVSSSSSLQESSSTVNSNSKSVISDSSSATSSSVISSSAESSSAESSASTSSSSAISSSATYLSSSNNSNPLIDHITPYSSTYTPQISADNTNKIYYYSVDSSSSTTSSSSSVAISSSSNDSTVSSTANSSYSSKNNSDVSSSTNKNNLNTKSKNNSNLNKKQVKKKFLARTINKINKSLSNEKDKIKNAKNSKDKSKHSKKYNKLKESLKKLKSEYQRI